MKLVIASVLLAAAPHCGQGNDSKTGELPPPGAEYGYLQEEYPAITWEMILARYPINSLVTEAVVLGMWYEDWAAAMILEAHFGTPLNEISVSGAIRDSGAETIQAFMSFFRGNEELMLTHLR